MQALQTAYISEIHVTLRYLFNQRPKKKKLEKFVIYTSSYTKQTKKWMKITVARGMKRHSITHHKLYLKALSEPSNTSKLNSVSA